MKKIFYEVKHSKKARKAFEFMLTEAMTVAFSIFETVFIVTAAMSYACQNQIGFIENLIYFGLITSIHSCLVLTIK